MADWKIEDYPSGMSGDLVVTCENADGTGFDFTGWTVVVRFKRSLTDTTALLTKSGTDVAGTSSGVVTIHLYADEITAPPAGSLAGTIEATKTSGGHSLKMVWRGTVRVKEKA